MNETTVLANTADVVVKIVGGATALGLLYIIGMLWLTYRRTKAEIQDSVRLEHIEQELRWLKKKAHREKKGD